MISYSHLINKVCMGLILAFSIVSCSDKSESDPSITTPSDTPMKTWNPFNFSTVQQVNLHVDYSAVRTYGPVFFGIYIEEPFNKSDDGSDIQWREEKDPIYEDYTNKEGKFDAIVELPAYAEHLYIATDNYYTGMMLLECDIRDGVASVVAEIHSDMVVPETELEIENKISSTSDVYAFEDKWPSKGDYDLNDVVIDAKHEKEYNEEGKIIREAFYLTTYQNYVELISGLAVILNTKVQPMIITQKIILRESTETIGKSFKKEGDVYYLTDDIKQEVGSTYILELTYNEGITSNQLASIQPFIYRSEGKYNWEVHLPWHAPTVKMAVSYFGKDDDCSDPLKGVYYVRQGDYPFALYLKGADIDAFKETILKRENESIPIDQFFPSFLDWSSSGGTASKDWYLRFK